MKALARLTMTWPADEPAPGVGQYLRTPRSRTAYEISSARKTEPKRPTFGRVTFVLMCRRVEPKEVPEQATVHMFAWNPRRRRQRA